MNGSKEAFRQSTSARQRPASGRPATAAAHRLAQRLGNQGLHHLLMRQQIVQAKLTVSHPSDPCEREADEVADRVMRMPAPIEPRSARGAQGSSTQIRRMCTECEELQREAAPGQHHAKPEKGSSSAFAMPSSIAFRAEHPAAWAGFDGIEAPPIVAEVVESPGEPLDPTTREFFEPRFGYDFSHVRIHTDANAQASARAVNAHAYTVGEHVAFGQGRYAPGDVTSHRLIAHELTHVVQQSAGVRRLQRQLAGCQDILMERGTGSFVPGRIVHQILAAHFKATVAGATSVAIPGASAAPLRSEAICGGNSKIIDPQIVGGASGAGFPDLARRTPGGILQVAEIKPAVVECLIDGEEQELNYINQGNSRDPEQSGWRESLGILVVAPMPPSAYSPPSLMLKLPNFEAELRTAWCTAGLLAYSVKLSGEPVSVPVPQTRRTKAKDQLRSEAISQGAAVGAAIVVTGATAIAGRALWKHFWRVVITRFAVREAIAVGLAAADGPLPIGDLIALGLTLVTIAQIISDWDEIWREADRLA